MGVGTSLLERQKGISQDIPLFIIACHVRIKICLMVTERASAFLIFITFPAQYCGYSADNCASGGIFIVQGKLLIKDLDNTLFIRAFILRHKGIMLLINFVFNFMTLVRYFFMISNNFPFYCTNVFQHNAADVATLNSLSR